jgi:RND family efflux transporter MFP subunit
VDIAFEVSGQLIERPINVGDVVTKGQMLAKLDPRDFANNVESATARETQAVAYFERIEKAHKSNAVSEQDLTDAQAQLDIAKADLKIWKKALTDSQIVAPFDGTISAIYVENYENIRAKQNIVRLMDISEIELKVDIPEKLIMLIPQIENITVTFDAYPNQPIPATIKEIGKEASATTRTYPVTLVMKQPDDFKILPGMTGQATGSGRASTTVEGTVQVPGEAIVEEAGKHYVWVVQEETMTVARQDIVPKESNQLGMLVQGLEKGQLVVTAGAHNLSKGQKIRLSVNDASTEK